MDSRFYHLSDPLPVAELVRVAGLDTDFLTDKAQGERLVSGVATYEQAGPADLAFSEKPVQDGCAGLLFAPEGSRGEGCVVETGAPRLAYAKAAVCLGQPKGFESGAPLLAADAVIAVDVVIGPGAVIGSGVQIGEGSVIGAGAVIGPGVCIGRGSQIGANAAVSFALVGDGVVIQAGAVIGETGFGMVPSPAGLLNIPHFGRVIIQEGAVIGANCCIARGMLEDTQIGPGARIDNLCQIAHNVSVGANAILVAACGISGSVTIGDGAILAGAVGVADHVNIGAGAKIAARSGLSRNIAAGEAWGGYPARPFAQWARESAWLALQVKRRKAR